MQKKELFTYLLTIFLVFFIYILSKFVFLRYNLFSTSFLALVLEGVPFLLIGALISSLIHIYVSDNFFTRLNKFGVFLGIFIAIFLGLFIPLCECAIIPVVARMIKKGLLPSIGISFMFAAPIINPITILSTYTAFSPNYSFAIIRSLGGAGIVFLMGLFVHFYLKNKVVIKNLDLEEKSLNKKNYNLSKIKKVCSHTFNEFVNLAVLFIIGSFIAAALKTYTPQEILISLGSNEYLSIISMMVLAFVLSVCSQADAFIAQGFYGHFTNASLLSFLIYGPMLDIKNTAVLLRNFERKFVLKMIILATVLTFGLSSLLNYLGV
jgi:uncharacterized membrane protein YraQ (UPF0718 family)